MLSGPGPWIAGAGVLAGAAAWFRYAVREERVSGRAGPALLHAVALFLLFASVRLPPLQGGAGKEPSKRTAALIDLSASMTLPSRPGAGTRVDSALSLLPALEADLRFGFGDTAFSLSSSPADPGPGARRSRLAPALRAARRAGATYAVVLTDGEIEDREEARREAERLGLAVEEVRVAAHVPRTSIAGARLPARVGAGDTVRVEVEIRTPAGPAVGERTAVRDSVDVILTGPGGERATRRLIPPDPGRSARVTLGLPAAPVGDEPEWRSYGVSLESGADPLRPGATIRDWVEIVGAPRGAVLVSTDPDWEPGFLMPVLERASAGGGRGFLRVADGSWITTGRRPAATTETEVRRAVASADLLVLQGATADLPAWLERAAGEARALLVLPRDAGSVPGLAGRIGAALPGEWYVAAPVPGSPVAEYVTGLDLSALPPVLALRELRGADGWTGLRVARDRSGEQRPLVLGFESGRARRAVVLAEGTWRWAARTGGPRQVYRALFAGVVGWLLERADREPVALDARALEEPDVLALRVAGGVRDLVVTLRDSTGAEVVRDSFAAPPVSLRVATPGDAGAATVVAEGIQSGRPFRWTRPVRLPGAESELAGRSTGRPLETTAGAARGAGSERRRGPPVWPFALATAAFCGEWIWRRRIGLR